MGDGSNIFSKEAYDEGILFWIVVQACKDILYYPSNGYNKTSFLHAYEWIVDDLPQEILGKEMTFSDALEALGVNPDNVEHIRYAISRGPQSNQERKTELARQAYQDMDLPDLEPSPWWRTITNLILNKDTIE